MSLQFRAEWHLDRALAIVEAQGEKAVRDCAQYLLDQSKMQVPHDTGTLEGTGAVDSHGLQATVSYDTPYAVRWHEHNANFQRGRKMKYLEDPCNDPSVQRRMLEYLRSNLEF